MTVKLSIILGKIAIYTNDQVFHAIAEMANYGEDKMKGAVIHWSLTFPDGKVYQKGHFTKMDIPVGSPFSLGKLAIPLSGIKKSRQARPQVVCQGRQYYKPLEYLGISPGITSCSFREFYYCP